MSDGGANSGAVILWARRAGALFGLGLGWGLFEAGWVRYRTLDVPVPGLPDELDGLRIVHLSDFHLGVPSRGRHAVRRASSAVAVRVAVERGARVEVIPGPNAAIASCRRAASLSTDTSASPASSDPDL